MEFVRKYNDSQLKDVVRRGDIWEVNLNGLDHEVKDRRYCIVISNDIANRFIDKITLIPLSTTFNSDKKYCTQVNIKHNGKEARARTELLKTVSRKRLLTWYGRISMDEMKDLEIALQMQLGLLYIPKKEYEEVTPLAE